MTRAPDERPTETLEHGDRAPATSEGAGIVLLYAPDVSGVPSALPLGRGGLVVGRDPPDGGLRLPFTSVSRTHARVFRGADGIVVEDLESRNGTFVNGEKAERAVVVVDGDEIRVGEVMFKIVARDAAAYADFPLAGRTLAAPFSRLRGGLVLERVRDEITKTARADFPILVTGETGTGKELVARAVHEASGRRGPFAVVRCTALAGAPLEDAFRAHASTLVLDEIADLPLDTQALLLRLLETRDGSDLRVVSTTHFALPLMVREGRFRADLYARIARHPIRVPPLRDRKEDVFQLACAFAERAGRPRTDLTPAFVLGLCAYDWPFNVRELESAIERAAALADGPFEERHLPPDALESVKDKPKDEPADLRAGRSSAPSEEEMRALVERHAGNVAAIARELAKDRVQIHRWLRRYAIRPEDYRR